RSRFGLVWQQSNTDDAQPARDFLFRDPIALPGAWADCARPLPGLLGLHVAYPERPGATLPRADRIDRTTLGAIVEDAVAVLLFPEAALPAECASIESVHLGKGLAAVFGYGFDLVVGDPDDAG